jgi:hypothetical protein
VLRFSDGFDMISGSGDVPIKYNGWLTGFFAGGILPGQGSPQALWMENSGGGVGQSFDVVIGTQDTIGAHMDYQPTSPLFSIEWLIFKNGGAPILAFALNSVTGQMKIFGPGGSLIGTTVYAFTAGVWANLQVLANFGTNGSVAIYVNGANALSQPSIPVNFGTLLPDRVGFCAQGYILDNYVVWDGQPGDFFGNAMPGPMQIAPLPPTADVATNWVPNVSGDTCTQMVNDLVGVASGSPDGDLTVIFPGTQNQMFTMTAAQCFGLVLGVTMNTVIRAFESFDSVDFLINGMGGSGVVGGATINFPSYVNDPGLGPNNIGLYQVYQITLGVSPNTGTQFTDAEINGDEWGFGCLPSYHLQVTQFYLEKITSLAGLPFNCGGGSYSF